MGKGIQKLVLRAAEETTGGCTLTLFQRSAAHSVAQNRRRKDRKLVTGGHLLSAEQQHAEFQKRGFIPHHVEKFVRGGHHFTAMA